MWAFVNLIPKWWEWRFLQNSLKLFWISVIFLLSGQSCRLWFHSCQVLHWFLLTHLPSPLTEVNLTARFSFPFCYCEKHPENELNDTENQITTFHAYFCWNELLGGYGFRVGSLIVVKRNWDYANEVLLDVFCFVLKCIIINTFYFFFPTGKTRKTRKFTRSRKIGAWKIPWNGEHDQWLRFRKEWEIYVF